MLSVRENGIESGPTDNAPFSVPAKEVLERP